MKILHIFCLISFVFLGANGQFPCPVAEEIAPCTCSTDDDFRISMDCSKVKSDEELSKAFSHTFPFNDIRQLLIKNKPSEARVPIEVINESTFSDKTFDEVIISHTNLHKVTLQAFAYSNTTMESLKLSDNLLSEFPFEVVSYLHKLKKLYLHNNNLQIMSDLTSESLEEIQLSYNRQLYFDVNAFKHVPNLRNILLQDTSLAHISPRLFSEQTSLEILDLSHNRLTALETDAILTKSTSLKEVKLNDNILKSAEIDKEFIKGESFVCFTIYNYITYYNLLLIYRFWFITSYPNFSEYK